MLFTILCMLTFVLKPFELGMSKLIENIPSPKGLFDIIFFHYLTFFFYYQKNVNYLID